MNDFKSDEGRKCNRPHKDAPTFAAFLTMIYNNASILAA